MAQNTLPTAVITGASSGIGLAVARELAGKGGRVIATGRNPERCAAAAKAIRAGASGGQVDMLLADLALMAEARQLAADITARTDRVHLLINNAGGMTTQKVITREGLEENFAGNHLGPFLFTNQLQPLLRRAAADAPPGTVRIINTSSNASEMIPTMDLDDMQGLDDFNAGSTYCRGKLANVAFTRALAKRIEGDGIVVHALHPGVVDSNFFAGQSAETMARVSTDAMITPEQAAAALVWLATDDEPGHSSGGYFHQRTLSKPNPLVEDDAFLEKFWEQSEKLVASALA
jgi:NAD(P)-dependent dehydrogenase (short-subunit alcohol dehydrogenase family)